MEGQLWGASFKGGFLSRMVNGGSRRLSAVNFE